MNDACRLVFSGVSPNRLFRDVSFQSCITTHTARRVAASRGIAPYWDVTLSSAPWISRAAVADVSSAAAAAAAATGDLPPAHL